jgi:DNA-3-methyladenine glycosylase
LSARNGAARLSRRFYTRPTLEVAEALLGRLLVHEGTDGPVGGRIVEVEAYLGPDDPASHAVAGRTARNRSMWGEAGHAYVYFTYGMHHCLNVVTERAGFPAAVLIRALEPTVGVDVLRRHRPHLADRLLLSGPGRVCAGLGLAREHDGLDLTSGPLWIGRQRGACAVARGPRVGIRVGLDRPWRLFVPGHPSVSAPSWAGRGPRRASRGPARAPGARRPASSRRISR